MSHRMVYSLLIAAAILLAGTVSAPAAGDAKSKGTTSPVVESNRAFEGLLVVKEADGVFVVRAEDGKKRRFTVHKDTAISRNGKPVAYRELKSRDHLRVTYTPDFVVTEIRASGS